MPRFSPWNGNYKRPERRQETKDFTFPDGKVMALTLRALGPLEEGKVWDKRDEYVNRFVTGREPLFDHEGVHYPASRSVLAIIAALEVMEVVPAKEADAPKEEPEPTAYTLLDWLRIVDIEDGPWGEIVAFADSFAPKADAAGNSSRSGQEVIEPTGGSSTSSLEADSPTPSP